MQHANRQLLEEARQRGFQAAPDYAKALAGFRYDEAPSRAADEDKLASLLSLQNQEASGSKLRVSVVRCCGKAEALTWLLS